MQQVKGLQPVWEQSIIDKERTTADLTVETPVKRETVFVPDKPWEMGTAHYLNVIYDSGIYKMYYLTHPEREEVAAPVLDAEGRETTVAIINTFVCYAESRDGLHWEKPELGICEWNGNKNNNIILRSEDKLERNEEDFFDNFFVFIDTNPDCDPQKRYKATAYMHYYKLGGYSSPDGIHFTLEGIFDIPGKFDTLNVCWWDQKIRKYVAYVRDFHDIPEDGTLNEGIRDARRTESEDFIHWTVPELITFNETEDYPIYTNNIMRYYRNPDILIGFPTRYEEHPEWTDNFEQLCGREERLAVMKKHKRFGLTVTDSIFMSSRDGLHWDKIDEALFTPEPEFGPNWIYGNCYNAYFMLETTAEDGINKELSLFVNHNYNRSIMDPTQNQTTDAMARYTVRRDGFACYRAKFKGSRVVTKPFVFEGEELLINFATSAKGSIVITMKDEDGNEAKSCKLFGDSDERRVRLEGKEVSDFAGKTVTLEFDMKDAKLYAFMFRSYK